MSFPALDQLAKTSARTWAKLPKTFGDRFVCSDGSVITRGQDYEVSPTLPNVLHPTKIVIGDLIPHTSWSASLANLLTKASWDKLRHPLIEQCSRACQLCGNGTLRSFDVHEIWSYQMPSPAEIRYAQNQDSLAFGVQKLVGLMVLCPACHACFHLGLANAKGRLGTVLSRLRVLNNWTEKQLGLYKRVVFDRWHAHSKVHWILDFSGLTHPDGGLTILPTWKALSHPGLFARGDQFTAITGIDWRFSGTREFSHGLDMSQE